MKSLSLNQKIWAVLGILCVAFVSSAIYSSVKLKEERATVDHISKVLIRQDQLTSDLSYYQKSLTAGIFELIVREDKEHLESLSKSFESNVEALYKSFDEYKKLTNAEGRKLAEDYDKDLQIFVPALQKAEAFGKLNQNEEAAAEVYKIDSLRKTLRVTIDKMNKLTADQLAEATKKADDDAQQALLVQAVFAIGSISGSLLIAFFVLRAVNRSIKEVVHGLASSSEQVTTAANQIAAASQELSQASTEQAAALVETASSTEEMSSMVTKNSENARETARTSALSTEKAVHGKSVVEKMMGSMTEISSSNDAVMNEVLQANQSMLDVVKVIEEIGSKTKVINDIVFQTKLLSFNASVEAARAGEHGKGFAVVAEEVGTLAAMSGKAAKEISDLLSVSVERVNQLVKTTQSSVQVKVDEGKRAVQSGNSVVQECGIVLDEIVDNVDQASKMATEISAASEEQSRGVIEITKAMGQLDQMTQMNTATSQECASAASSLSTQAESLKSLVKNLVVAIDGDKGGATNSFATAPVKVNEHKVAAKNNVVALKSHKKAPLKVSSEPKVSFENPRKVIGSDVPSHDDKGFKDI